MPKIPDCDRCLLYTHNPYLVCGVQPLGVKTENCLDFRADPEVEEDEAWSPEGYSFYNGDLVKNPSRYTQLTLIQPIAVQDGWRFLIHRLLARWQHIYLCSHPR